MIKKNSIEIVFAEFGARARKPDTVMIDKYFRGASVSFYGDHNSSPICIQSHPRYGWRMNDYYKVKGMLNSKAEVAIAFDADMEIISPQVRTIVPLVKKFGLCLPSNSRYLVRVDTLVGADSDLKLDETYGNAYAFNAAIMALDKNNANAVSCMERYCQIMEYQPVRGPLALWRACWDTGFYPCLLPQQWCVCEKDVGIGEEIILHTGHQKVKDYYRR